MGHVFDFHDARKYEEWCNTPRSRAVIEMESRLMLDMLRPARGDTVLDIGCGIGQRLFSFLELGIDVTGIDPSPYMLDIARKSLGNRVDFHRAFAEDLPFCDNSFNHASIVTTLEFVENPHKALEEAFRVAKDRVFLGILNRYAARAVNLRVRGMVDQNNVYRHAVFFSTWRLKQMIRRILGNVPIHCRSICHLPAATGGIVGRIERWRFMQRCPFGDFAGVLVIPVPRLRTHPITIKYSAPAGCNAGVTPGLTTLPSRGENTLPPVLCKETTHGSPSV
jgi:ubiquinone/menaquinone biosynthesis C-methylase UbiE